MSESPRVEVAIVGGGIVGVATARALLMRARVPLAVLEAEPRLAAHQTGNNSGVIHSGLYYAPGSEKARNCVRGREALVRFCEQQGIAHERCGKLVVATRPEEVGQIDRLEERGRANGLDGLRRLRPEEIRELEPHAGGIAGLFVPHTGIVDYVQVTEALAAEARGLGAEMVLGARVTGVVRREEELVVQTTAGDRRCRYLVNCAGLQSDRVALLCGVRPGVRIVPFRGEYYQLLPARRHLVRNLIYPVPDPRFPFLGVHFTRRISGEVDAGPNAVVALHREGYSRVSFSLHDSIDILGYPGFWRLATRYLGTGLGEMWRSLSKRAFVAALRGLLPELEEADLTHAGAGVRAQALARNGSLVDDFRIVEAERMIHVINAPSPAATAALAIAETIAAAAGQRFDLGRPVAR